MTCPDGARFDGFGDALSSLDIWEAGFCMYATPMGPEVVASLVYSAVMLGMFLRTQSVAIPAILFIILGGTMLANMFAVIAPIVAFIVLVSAPIALTALIWTTDRLG